MIFTDKERLTSSLPPLVSNSHVVVRRFLKKESRNRDARDSSRFAPLSLPLLYSPSSINGRVAVALRHSSNEGPSLFPSSPHTQISLLFLEWYNRELISIFWCVKEIMQLTREREEAGNENRPWTIVFIIVCFCHSRGCLQFSSSFISIHLKVLQNCFNTLLLAEFGHFSLSSIRFSYNPNCLSSQFATKMSRRTRTVRNMKEDDGDEEITSGDEAEREYERHADEVSHSLFYC